MKTILATLALLAAPAAGGTDFIEDYCTLNSIVVGSVAVMYVDHNLDRSSVWMLLDEFFAPGEWNAGRTWNATDDIINRIDRGETPASLLRWSLGTCLEEF